MAGLKPIVLGAPWRGKQSKTALADSNASYVYDSLDVWPYDAKTERDRLAIRPGYAAFGSNTGVNLISEIAVAADSGGQETLARQLIIATGGGLKTVNSSGTASNVGNTGIVSSENVQAASYITTLYIANDTGSTTHRLYTYDAAAHAEWAATNGGTIPALCKLICVWQTRIVLAGDPQNPHVVNFSRADDPLDFDFTDEDNFAAVSVPDINDRVTCLIPHDNDCMLAGTLDAVWMFQGNPVVGTLEKLPGVCGPVNATAWCADPYGYKYFLSRIGLYRMSPGCGSVPQPVSEKYIPSSLIGVDGVNNVAYMAYDSRFRCIQIHVANVSGTDLSQSWHYFPEYPGGELGGSFWPQTSPGAGLLAIYNYAPLETTDKSGVLMGTTAALTRLDRTAALAGATAYAKWVYPMAALGEKSVTRESHWVFGDNTTNDCDGTVTIYGGETAEDVIAEPASREAQTTIAAIEANHNRFIHNVSGTYGMAVITQETAADHISLERGMIPLRPAGRFRG